MPEDKTLSNHNRSGAWMWQLGIVVPEGRPTEYPICPFCTTAPFQEFGFGQTLPSRCETCGAKLKLD